MHLSLMIPAIWYENHLESPSYRVTGISLPGSPLVVSGHNGRVAWGYTAGFADNQDLYQENLRQAPEGAASPWEYEYQGNWISAEVRMEEIKVRDADSVMQEVIVTHHGPIINNLVPDEADEPLALRWTAHEPNGEVMCVLARMNRAQNCTAFRSALRGWSGPVLNTVFADVDGNIGYSLIGEVPIRAQGDGKLPVPGWTGENEWLGLIPFDDLPHTMNPAQGYVATANNRVSGPDYPYFLGSDYVSGDRAERITELILSRPKIDIAYIQAMQMDFLSPSAQSMAQVVGSLQIDDPELTPLVDMMRSWDGTLRAESTEAVIYEVLNRQILALLLENRLGSLLPRYTGKGPNLLVFESTWGTTRRNGCAA
jgi:penicillin G amidase